MTINKNFVVRNGLEVAQTLLYADDVTNKVGINSAIPEFELDLYGDVRITGALSVGGTTGTPSQYLESTGDGLRWKQTPEIREKYTYSAIDGQTIYPPVGFAPFNDIQFVDVYIDGVLLSSSEYTATNTNTAIELAVPTLAGETVELIVYNPGHISTGGTGILGITISEEGVVAGFGEYVTHIDFIGAAVTALQSGTGVTVYVGDVDVRAEGFWGSNLEYGSPVLTGIHTTAFVGIGSTFATVELDVIGNAKVSGIFTAGTLSGSGSSITGLTNANLSGSAAITNNNLANSTVSYGGVALSLGGSDSTPAFNLVDATNYPYSSLTGITTDILGDTTPQLGGNLDLNNRSITGTGNININGTVNVGGVSTFTGLINATGGASISNLNVSGISTFVGTLNASGDIDVDGHTELDNLNVSGISTFIGTLNAGIVTASDFFGNGAGISSIVAIGTEPPANPYSGDLWFDSDYGKGFIYYDDGDSSQWVDFSGFGFGGNGLLEIVNDTTPQLGGNLDLNGNNITGSGSISISGISTFSSDVNVGVDTSSGVILTSPNGTRYRLIVDNSGNLSTTLV